MEQEERDLRPANKNDDMELYFMVYAIAFNLIEWTK